MSSEVVVRMSRKRGRLPDTMNRYSKLVSPSRATDPADPCEPVERAGEGAWDEVLLMLGHMQARQDAHDAKLDALKTQMEAMTMELARYKGALGVWFWLLSAIGAGALAFKDELVKLAKGG